MGRARQAQPPGRDPIGAVLAGGCGRRIGGAKALAELAGRPLISHPLEAVERAGLEPVVVAKPGSQLPSLNTRVIREPAEPTHPLCGILAALDQGRPAVVLGCDMPFVPPGLLAWLAGLEVRAAAARIGGRLEPFPARIEPAAAPALREALDHRAPLREALAELHPYIVGEAELNRFGDPTRITASVNDPPSLAAAERLLVPDRGAAGVGSTYESAVPTRIGNRVGEPGHRGTAGRVRPGLAAGRSWSGAEGAAGDVG